MPQWGGERAGFESCYSDRACHSGGERGLALSHATVTGHATVWGERGLALSHTTVSGHATVGGREGWLESYYSVRFRLEQTQYTHR